MMSIKKAAVQESRGELRRSQLLETSLYVFSTQGFSRTSIRELAKAANVSQGLIYHYFSNKEEILEAIVEQHSFLPLLKQILYENRECPLDQVLEDLARSFNNLLEEKTHLLEIFIQEAESNNKVRGIWSNLCTEAINLLAEYINLRVVRDDLRPHQAEVAARCLFTAIFMYHFTRDIFQPADIDREEFIQEALTNIIGGLENVYSRQRPVC